MFLLSLYFELCWCPGDINDELIIHTFTENKDPCVRELTDDNFEHLTQVSTGATTGDWFVLL